MRRSSCRGKGTAAKRHRLHDPHQYGDERKQQWIERGAVVRAYLGVSLDRSRIEVSLLVFRDKQAIKVNIVVGNRGKFEKSPGKE